MVSIEKKCTKDKFLIFKRTHMLKNKNSKYSYPDNKNNMGKQNNNKNKNTDHKETVLNYDTSTNIENEDRGNQSDLQWNHGNAK